MFDYSVIFENSVDPMLVLERGSIVHYNKAAVHLFGLKHGQQLERKKLSKLFSQSPRSGISNSRIIKEACDKAQLLGSKKLVLNVDLNGNNLWLDTTFTALKDTEGNQMNHVVMRDLSSLLEKENYPQYLKEIENKLLNAQEKLVDALKLARLTTWELWVKDDKMVLDQQFCQAIGLNYDPQKEPAQGLAYVNKYLIESDRSLVLQAYQDAIDTLDENYKSMIEYRIKVDQNVYTILATVRVVKDQHGKTVKVYGTGQDVSDVRRNEEELEKYRKELEYLVQTRTQELKTSEEKLTDALELASLGTWEFDFANGNFTLSENFFKEIKDGFDLGSANQFSYARFLEIVHPDDKQLFLDFTNKALQAKNENFLDYLEYRIISKRGGIRNIYISLKVEKGQDGRNIKHYGTLQNITNIRKTEAEMKRLTAIIENTSDNVCVITP
ncbi:MAG: PAS domain-containing protein, partial [Bacteroidetes bacterium]|nr:PAS domain-containing protein [Bacteroidota bacterium]